MNESYHALIIGAGASQRLFHLTRKKPKSFLNIHDKKIIEYTLDYLNERSFKRVTMVVGYLSDLVIRTLGTQYKGLTIDYVVSKDYETTGHGYSIFLSRERWEKEKRPVVLIHADIFYHPSILDRVLTSQYKDVIGVGVGVSGADAAVCAEGSRIIEMKKGMDQKDGMVGHLIGIARWSSEFMSGFYSFMEEFFRQNGNNHNWEPVFDSYLSKKRPEVHYVDCNDLPWININYEKDYIFAKTELYDHILKKESANV